VNAVSFFRSRRNGLSKGVTRRTISRVLSGRPVRAADSGDLGDLVRMSWLKAAPSILTSSFDGGRSDLDLASWPAACSSSSTSPLP
jgi:hypothetical protein